MGECILNLHSIALQADALQRENDTLRSSANAMATQLDSLAALSHHVASPHAKAAAAVAAAAGRGGGARMALVGKSLISQDSLADSRAGTSAAGLASRDQGREEGGWSEHRRGGGGAQDQSAAAAQVWGDWETPGRRGRGVAAERPAGLMSAERAGGEGEEGAVVRGSHVQRVRRLLDESGGGCGASQGETGEDAGAWRERWKRVGLQEKEGSDADESAASSKLRSSGSVLGLPPPTARKDRYTLARERDERQRLHYSPLPERQQKQGAVTWMDGGAGNGGGSSGVRSGELHLFASQMSATADAPDSPLRRTSPRRTSLLPPPPAPSNSLASAHTLLLYLTYPPADLSREESGVTPALLSHDGERRCGSHARGRRLLYT